MGSVVYRDRERDRYDDSKTTVSARRDRDGGYTTVKRYVVKAEDDGRSSVGRDRGGRDRGVERIEETRIVTRDREEDRPRREEPRYTERELVIRRDRDDEPRYERRREEPAERELVIRRTTEDRGRDERDLAVSRFDDRRYDYDVLSPERRDYGDRELQKYVRTNEYYGLPNQPQTIIIRNEPIIIRERARDDDYQIVRKSDIDDEKSVARRDPDRDRGPRDEEYFYEKKVKERAVEGRRRDDEEDDYYERRSMNREVSPHDSVSQVGGGRERRRDRNRDRDRDRDYDSDDSIVYVRKEVREDEGFDRSQSPHHRRHLAEGLIAGVGVAELLRNHKEKEGREVSTGIGRIGRDVAAGAVGALAAEGISRARSWHRSKSRRRGEDDRDRSESRETRRDRRRGSRDRDRGRDRDRSDSESPSNLEKYGKLGLGAAALAAAAAFAAKKFNDNKEEKEEKGRSRSRVRRGEDDVSINDPNANDARNPSHRNKVMAGAGLAGAALAGLIERQRSKSRGPGERSQSRVRQALPIVAAGLASAGAAALYERNKAKNEAETVAKEQRKRRTRSRSRSKSRTRYDQNQVYGGARGATASDPGLIEYGTGPMQGNNFGPDYYGRPAPQEPYYGDHTAMVPAAAAGAAGYGAAREARSRSRSLSRDRRRDDESFEDEEDDSRRRRHRKHRSKSRDAAAAGLGAAGGVLAATEYERRKQEKRERKARRRQQEEQGIDPYAEGYNNQQQAYTPPPPPPPVENAYAPAQGYYPPQPTNAFPPPPGVNAAPYQNHNPSTASGFYAPGQTYNSNEFPPPPGAVPVQPAQQYPEQYGTGTYVDPYAQRGRSAGPENVSFGNPFPNQNPAVDAGLNLPYQPPHLPPTSVPPPPPNPPPMINVQRPSVSESSDVNRTENLYMPNTGPESFAPSSEPRKSVQFASSPLEREVTNETQPTRPEIRRTKTPAVPNRGYEASDEPDSPDDHRQRADFSRSQPEGIDDDGERRKRKHHRRQRSHDPSASTTRDYLSARGSGDRGTSPLSDDVEVLPDRFDEQGRRVPEPGESQQDFIDRVLAGQGLSGRVFGNFANGIFGPEGRKKKGNDLDM